MQFSNKNIFWKKAWKLLISFFTQKHVLLFLIINILIPPNFLSRLEEKLMDTVTFGYINFLCEFLFFRWRKKSVILLGSVWMFQYCNQVGSPSTIWFGFPNPFLPIAYPVPIAAKICLIVPILWSTWISDHIWFCLNFQIEFFQWSTKSQLLFRTIWMF